MPNEIFTSYKSLKMSRSLAPFSAIQSGYENKGEA